MTHVLHTLYFTLGTRLQSDAAVSDGESGEAQKQCSGSARGVKGINVINFTIFYSTFL